MAAMRRKKRIKMLTHKDDDDRSRIKEKGRKIGGKISKFTTLNNFLSQGIFFSSFQQWKNGWV